MKKKKANIILAIVAQCLIIAISIGIAMNSLYLHSHKLNHGQTVTHAHPWAGDHPDEHSHSYEQIIALESFQELFTYFVLVCMALLMPKLVHILSLLFSNWHLQLPFTSSGRAPPVQFS